MTLVQEKISRIKILLKAHPKGLTITDISTKLKMNRNSAAKYLEILQISGQVESKSYGTARVFFLTHRLPISALVSITSDLVVTLDENNRILFVNEGFCNLFSIKKDDATGNHIVDLFKTGIGSDVLPGVFSDVIADQEKVQTIRWPMNSGDLFFKIKSVKTVFDDGSRGITIIMEDITRERLDKIELEAKESRYRGIVEDQTEFIIRFLPGGNLSFVNPSYSQFMKKKPEELLGMNFADTIHTRDRPVFEKTLHSLRREKPVAVFECRFTMPRYPVRWVAWTLRAMYNGEKQPVEYQAVGQDITDKKEASDKIQKSIAQMEFFSKELQHFIELAPGDNIYKAIAAGLSEIVPEAFIFVSSYDPESISLTIRAAFPQRDHDQLFRSIGRDLIGMKIRVGDTTPPEEYLSGKVFAVKNNLYNFIFRQMSENICNTIVDSLDLGDFYSIGLMWKETLLGNIIIALKKGYSLEDKSLIEAYVKAASISLKRSMAENALKESESLYHTVIENIDDVFYRADTEGNLVMASPRWANLLGYSSDDDCKGRNIAKDFYMEPEKRKDFLAAIAAKGSVKNYEIVLKRKDGSPVYLWTNSYIYYGKDGSVLGIEGVLHDISERKAAEKKIHRYIGETEFLSQKLLDFMTLRPSENIYDKIASDFSSLVPGAMVAVNSFNPETGIVTVRAAVMSGTQRDTIKRILGSEPVGMGYPIDENGRTMMLKERLHNDHISMYEAFFKSVPEPVCNQLESELDIGEIYGIGFVRSGKILGNAGIFLGRGERTPDFLMVEMYARIASIALQRYSAEEARRKSDEVFYNIAQNSPLPIALIEPDGTYRYINESFTRVFGYNLNDFHTGREWFCQVFPDREVRKNAIALWKSDRAQYETGCPFTRTFPIRCKDNTVKEIIFRQVSLSDGKMCIVYEDITERNRAEQAHRLYSSIIESASDAVIAKDSHGTIISWNKAAETLYGYSATEMMGQNIGLLVPADRKDEMEKIHRQIEHGDSVNNFETRRIRKDGKLIDVSVTISPITDENGTITGASTIARDITSRKAEERLREDEEQYRSLVENISVGVYRSTGDPMGKFIWGNTSLVHILGYPSLDQLREVEIANIFVEHDGRKNLLDSLKREGFVKNREIELQRADGQKIVVLVTALARFSTNGELSCINGIVEDITGQRHAEHRAEVIGRQLEDILACIPDPVVIVDEKNVVIAWNAAMEQLTGVQKEDMIGKSDFEHCLPFYDPARPPLFTLFSADDRDLGRYYPGAYRHGSMIVAQVKDLIHPDDPSAFFTIRVSPLYDHQGSRAGAVQVIQAATPDGRSRTISPPLDHIFSTAPEMSAHIPPD